ncbi:30S ribosomal protein S13 [Wolbachia endosymbiont of Howardula sp.]|uniref:30S ribosomal protein S13 n=1 Tax=Wolbachia endosymbiont of Howardula sp. TaxID=2916816 RepID=UPI00217DBEFA|nr:30S ribosomal protein S13 [Wolbachia endosymbiont of Howardula sp.]UWI83150.1 30S ribosomal protein S13 [Wolbachia endosymbiont of Howardula sp.]
MRIAGVNVPFKKCTPFALTYIHGLGIKTAHIICHACNIDESTRVSELTEEDIKKINTFIRQFYVIEGERRKEVATDIKSLIDLGCYRGLRHRKSLPVRGQRTHTNAKTRKGKSRLPISHKK